MARRIITAFIWDSYAKTLSEAAGALDIDLRIYTRVMLSDGPHIVDEMRASAEESDVVMIHMMGSELMAEVAGIVTKLPERVKVLSMGKDPMCFVYTNAPKEVAVRCCDYLHVNGRENCESCLRLIQKEIFGMDVEVPDVVRIPYHGLVDGTGKRYDSLEEYLKDNPPIEGGKWVGIITSRASWVNDNCDVEYLIMRRFREKGFNPIMIYASPRTVPKEDMLGLADAALRYMSLDGKFLPSAIVKCSVLQFGQASEFGKEHPTDLLTELNVPIFQPVVPTSMSRKKFEESTGLRNDATYAITYQEFEGTIEPILIGFSRQDNTSDVHRTPIPERVDRLVDRVIRRIALSEKPNSEKTVAFMLNNYPCAGAEANVGEAHNLNVMDSLANIFARMREEGYTVDAPSDGKGIKDYIMDHKAFSEFRWTDAAEIERCGGVLHHMTVGEYREWFDTLSDKVKEDVIRVWGEPPGQSMVKDGEILITGVRFGNVLVMVQPKRGCYGPKCDGTVCRILHDPVCPPTHQYLATYHWLDSISKVDAIVHTGMHGNMENLPGKGAGLTSDCYPDICIGTMPHLYIFDAGAPPAAAAAKRRGYGTLIDHLPPAVERVKPYGPIEDLRVALEQYGSSKDDALRAEQYRKVLVEAGRAAGMEEKDLSDDRELAAIVKSCTEEYTRVTRTSIQTGLHTMGDPVTTERKTAIISAILAYGEDSINRKLASLKGIDYLRAETEPETVDPSSGRMNAAIVEDIDAQCVRMVSDVLAGGECLLGPETMDRILAISRRIDASDEIGAFVNALSGGHTPAGPCGLITRGRPEILPTGRNPFILDPRSVPTRTAWNTGRILADKTIERFREDTGGVPENISMFWLSSDLMNDGGEMMCEILYLIGAEPVWEKDGQVKGFRIIPLEELGRPRIDVTIRGSGILTNTFPHCIDLVDSAVVAVSALDEPLEMNNVRRHTLESIEDGIAEEDATARIFSSAPGATTSGVPLAVYANAWKTERDLADIYVATNGYAYGNERNGKPLHGQFMNALSNTSLTYTKMATDEYDILGSPGFYGNIGGMAVASKIITGKEVRSYFADTRIPGAAGVRTLKDEIRRVTRARLLNPQWIEGMKAAGYQGAAEIMKRSGRVYGFGATTDAVDDGIFDDIARTFVNDPEMERFFRENNPYAGEEISRRLLEAYERGFWKADPEVLEELKKVYLRFEGDMEGLAGDGEYQGSTTEIATYRDVEAWQASNAQVMESVRKMMDKRTN